MGRGTAGEALFQACISRHLGRSPASEAIAEMKCAQLESQSISVVTSPQSLARRSRSQARSHLQLLWDCEVLSTNLFEAPPAGKLGKMRSIQEAPQGPCGICTQRSQYLQQTSFTMLGFRRSLGKVQGRLRIIMGRMHLGLWRWSEDAVPMNLRSRALPLSPIRVPPVDHDFLFFRRVGTASNHAF